MDDRWIKINKDYIRVEAIEGLSPYLDKDSKKEYTKIIMVSGYPLVLKRSVEDVADWFKTIGVIPKEKGKLFTYED